MESDFGFERQQIRIRQYIFSERSLQTADAANHAVDLVSRRNVEMPEPTSSTAAGHVKTQHRRQRLVGMICLTGADLGVQRIDTTGVHAHEDLTRPLVQDEASSVCCERSPGMFNDVGFQSTSPFAAGPSLRSESHSSLLPR